MRVKRVKIIIGAIILIALIVGLGFYIKMGLFQQKSGENAYNIAHIEDFLKIPEPDIEPSVPVDTMESTVSKTQKVSESPTIPKPTSRKVEKKSKSKSKEEKSETAEVPRREESPEVKIDIGEITVPEITPQLEGGGISISGTIALEQVYYEKHDLKEAYRMAKDILRDNPSDPIANKILKLVELEKKANQALKRGDYGKAIFYFQKMQELDPDNIWAKKGIIKAQSGG